MIIMLHDDNLVVTRHDQMERLSQRYRNGNVYRDTLGIFHWHAIFTRDRVSRKIAKENCIHLDDS